MSKLVVDLDKKEEKSVGGADAPEFGEYQKPKKRSFFLKFLAVIGAVFLVTLLIGVIGGVVYWQYLKTTPQYSLALLIDAAKRDDTKMVDELVDTDAVIDDFVPQVVDKAVDIYGRGVDPKILKRITGIATPFLPVVKKRARAELPDLLREKTKNFEKVPFWAIVIGADRYLEIKTDGDISTIESKGSDRSLNLSMKRNGDIWRIVALKDEKLATNIAQKIGQEIIGLGKMKGKNTLEDFGKRIGIPKLGEIIKDAGDIINKK